MRTDGATTRPVNREPRQMVFQIGSRYKEKARELARQKDTSMREAVRMAVRDLEKEPIADEAPQRVETLGVEFTAEETQRLERLAKRHGMAMKDIIEVAIHLSYEREVGTPRPRGNNLRQELLNRKLTPVTIPA